MVARVEGEPHGERRGTVDCWSFEASVIENMYRHCIYCHVPLGNNSVIETFPVGRRLAFDAAKGRLWAVCRKCERWNLTPLEERWEAVEDCERRFRAARKRVSTENIGLARLDEGLELVRIGEPLRPEFAAWRYGDQFGRRRRRAIVVGTSVGVVAGALVVGHVATGVAAGGALQLLQALLNGFNAFRAVRVVARVPVSAGPPLKVRPTHLAKARLAPDPSDAAGWRLELAHSRGTAVLSGPAAVNAAGLIMPKINGRGGSKQQVQEAVQRIDLFGGPERFLRSVAQERPESSVDRACRVANQCADKLAEITEPHSLPGVDVPGPQPALAGAAGFTPDSRLLHGDYGRAAWGALRHLAPATRLAVEMAVNEDAERGAMEGELELLEMAWRDAEEIASIADDLLLPEETEAQLETLKRAQGARR